MKQLFLRLALWYTLRGDTVLCWAIDRIFHIPTRGSLLVFWRITESLESMIISCGVKTIPIIFRHHETTFTRFLIFNLFLSIHRFYFAIIFSFRMPTLKKVLLAWSRNLWSINMVRILARLLHSMIAKSSQQTIDKASYKKELKLGRIVLKELCILIAIWNLWKLWHTILQ